MKTTKKRLLNIVTAASIAVNLVMLGGLGYIAAVDIHISHLDSSLNSPVMVYIPKAVPSSGVESSTQVPAKQ